MNAVGAEDPTTSPSVRSVRRHWKVAPKLPLSVASVAQATTNHLVSYQPAEVETEEEEAAA